MILPVSVGTLNILFNAVCVFKIDTEENIKTVADKHKKYNFNIPENLNFLVIDIGPKRSPIFPPNDEYSFHVLVFEPQVDIVTEFSKISSRMHVIPSTVGAQCGVSSVIHNGLNQKLVINNKRPRLESESKDSLIIKLPLGEILSEIPPKTEIFVRCDSQYFDFEEAQQIGSVLKRVSLLKKEIAAPVPDDHKIDNETEKWIQLMKSLGFVMLKLDPVSKTKRECVWLNPTPLLPEPKNFLTQNLNGLDPAEWTIKVKIKNYIMLSFNTIFFGPEEVSIYTEEKPKILSKDEALWDMIPPENKVFPENAFKVVLKCRPEVIQDKENTTTTQIEGQLKAVIEQSSTESENTAPLVDKEVYITHSFFKGGLHCGHAEESKPSEAFFCWSRYQLIIGNYQVLCGKDFAWAAVKDMKIPDKAVLGGKDSNGDNMFITLAHEKDRTFIGKVCANWIVTEDNVQKLKCQYYDGKSLLTDDFDVLVYTGASK